MKSDPILPEVVFLPESHPGLPFPFDPSISILVFLPESSHHDEEIAYLTKMFGAAQKVMGKDILTVSLTSSDQLTFHDLSRQSAISDIYLFGIEASQIGLQSSLPYGSSAQMGDIFLHRTDLPLKVSKNEEMRKRIWDLFQKRYLHESPN